MSIINRNSLPKEDRVLMICDKRDLERGVICRNPVIGKEALIKLGPWDLLLLDNDMGPCWEDGFKLLDWLEKPENRKYLPAKFRCVSGNNAASNRMNGVAARLYRQVERVERRIDSTSTLLFSDPIGEHDDLIDAFLEGGR